MHSTRIAYFHAGLPKTGSSSIQSALYASRATLAAAGIHYWSVAENHSWPLSLVHGQEADQSDIRDGAHKRRKYGHPAEIMRGLESELASDWRKFIISAERISSLTGAQQKSLRDLVLSHADEVKVVAYVREPRGWISSMVQQKLKVGMTIADSLSKYASLPYRMRMEPLLTTFGETNVDFRLYRSDWGVNGIQGDFLTAIGEPATLAQDVGDVRTNASLTALEVNFFDRVNTELQAQEQTFRRGHYARRHIRGLFGGPKFALDDATIERIISENSDQIAWASQKVGHDLGDSGSIAASTADVDISPAAMTLIVRLLSTIAEDRDERDRLRSRQEQDSRADPDEADD